MMESILKPFRVLFVCLGEAKMRKSRFRKAIEKNVDVRDPFFPDVGRWLILSPQEEPKPRLHFTLFRSFSDPRGNCICSGIMFSNFAGFCSFWTCFLMIVDSFLPLTFANAAAFSETRF